MPPRSRHLTLYGTKNLRDLGGYKGAGGKETRWGVVYRGDQLSAVDEEDAADILVDQYHVRRTYDLRGTNEAANKPYKIRDVERIPVPMPINSVYDRYAAVKPVTKTHVQQLMRELAEFLVSKFAISAGEVLHDIALRGVSDEEGVLIHCTLGKDRTGFVCFLLLKILGVSDEEVLEDYLMTNKYISPPQAQGNRRQSYALAFDGQETLQTFYSASPEFLESLRLAIEERGGIEKFAVEDMGLSHGDLDKLRAKLLS
eukprot:gene10620-7380_t